MAFRIKDLDGKLLITQEVAEMLKLSTSRIRQMVEQGKLEVARTPIKGQRIFYVADVERLRRKREEK